MSKDLAWPGGILTIRFRIRPSLTACKCWQMARTGMPSMKGVSGSGTGQACRTNSCSCLLVSSAFTARRLRAGLFEDGVELAELIVVKCGVVKLFIFNLVNQV